MNDFLMYHIGRKGMYQADYRDSAGQWVSMVYRNQFDIRYYIDVERITS